MPARVPPGAAGPPPGVAKPPRSSVRPPPARRVPMAQAASQRARAARELFAPLGPTYDRYARLLSFGQDPRWRRFMVSRVPRGSRVLDVATGTGAVAEALLARDCRVVGIDQSREMLAVAHRRLPEVPLEEGRAENLPFPQPPVEAPTFTHPP